MFLTGENNLDNSSIRLDGKKILITGTSRPLGIGANLARRFARSGATVAVHGFSEYDLTVGCNKSATPNCVAKEAIINLCRQSAALLSKRNIRVNCINPGANDTGYWCTPDDAADLALFLHSSYARHITGQMIASDKGLSLGGWAL